MNNELIKFLEFRGWTKKEINSKFLVHYKKDLLTINIPALDTTDYHKIMDNNLKIIAEVEKLNKYQVAYLTNCKVRLDTEYILNLDSSINWINMIKLENIDFYKNNKIIKIDSSLGNIYRQYNNLNNIDFVKIYL